MDGAANTASVCKGANGSDTIIDIANQLLAASTGIGGFGLYWTAYAGVFTVNGGAGTWMQVGGGQGADTYNTHWTFGFAMTSNGMETGMGLTFR